jgi:hypothetical protein
LKSSAVASLLLLAFACRATADENTALRRLLKGGGQVVIMRRAASEPLATGNLILVTHQVNIRALTGLFPARGK